MGKDYTFEAEIAEYRNQKIVVDGVERAFENFKRYQAFGKRIIPHVEKELPGYHVSFYSSGSGMFATLTLHINPVRNIVPSERIAISIYPNSNVDVSWQEKFTKELDRFKPEASLAKLERDHKLVGRIQDIQTRLEQIRRDLADEARYVVELATTEGDTDVSYVLSTMFSDLFNS